MKTILDNIKENKIKEVAELRSQKRYVDFEKETYFHRETISLRKRLIALEFGIIAEIKRKSPSSGVINEEVDVLEQARKYQSGGAAAISCLTDQRFFNGSNQDLMSIRSVDLPILRKDFIIDEIQLFEAKAIGADVILLIAELLTAEEALNLTIMAQQLGLEVLMEFHDRTQLSKLNEHVDIIGVNNRNLHTQEVTIQSSIEHFPFLPKDRPVISESGMRSIQDLEKIQYTGFKGALVGEFLMRQENPEETLSRFNSLSNVHTF